VRDFRETMRTTAPAQRAALPASVFDFLPDGAKRNAGGATGARYGTLAEAIDKAARAAGAWLRAGRAANPV
jgi:hypothetical protein